MLFVRLKIKHTARMSAWKAPEAIFEDMAIRLMTYRCSGQAKVRIDRPCVWVATVNNIYVERVSQSAMWYTSKVFGHHLDVDVPP